MISDKEYQSMQKGLCEEMGKQLACIPQSLSLDKYDFCACLGRELKFQRSGKSKAPETIQSYLENGIHPQYLINNYNILLYGVQQAVKKCIRNYPNPTNSQELWAKNCITLLKPLNRIHKDAIRLEFRHLKKMDPFNNPKVLLLEFTYEHFPEDYVHSSFDNPFLTKEQSEMIKAELYPHIGYFFKIAKEKDDFSMHSARILAFCFGIWPENSTAEIALDFEHIKALRWALRQHSAWLFEKFDNVSPKIKMPRLPTSHEMLSFTKLKLALDNCEI